MAKAVKPIYLPGESLDIQITRPGKESGQGVGFLDDGTMVVVDNARKKVGREVECVVTSLVQTASGRMIFARYENSKPRTDPQDAGTPPDDNEPTANEEDKESEKTQK